METPSLNIYNNLNSTVHINTHHGLQHTSISQAMVEYSHVPLLECFQFFLLYFKRHRLQLWDMANVNTCQLSNFTSSNDCDMHTNTPHPNHHHPYPSCQYKQLCLEALKENCSAYVPQVYVKQPQTLIAHENGCVLAHVYAMLTYSVLLYICCSWFTPKLQRVQYIRIYVQSVC